MRNPYSTVAELSAPGEGQQQQGFVSTTGNWFWETLPRASLAWAGDEVPGDHTKGSKLVVMLLTVKHPP
jgi:hypothetical protein